MDDRESRLMEDMLRVTEREIAELGIMIETACEEGDIKFILNLSRTTRHRRVACCEAALSSRSGVVLEHDQNFPASPNQKQANLPPVRDWMGSSDISRDHNCEQAYVLDSLLLDFKDARKEIDIEGFDLQRKDIAQLEFREGIVVPVDFAFLNYRGRSYYTDSGEVLSACRSVIDIIAPFEEHGKVSVFGIDYFNKLFFSREKVPEAPRVYHTDHEQSKDWKQYVLDTE